LPQKAPSKVIGKEHSRTRRIIMKKEATLARRKGSQTMTPDHPRWDEFCTILAGPVRIIQEKSDTGKSCLDCPTCNDSSFAKAILREHFPEVDVAPSLEYFEENGGFCDCEILMNVAGIRLNGRCPDLGGMILKVMDWFDEQMELRSTERA
jgi:hypothetical protein